MSKIEINNIYKIFGPTPGTVLENVKAGATKEEVLDQTGHTVGFQSQVLSVELFLLGYPTIF